MKVEPGLALLALGLAQMAGDVLGLLPLKAVALATAAAPAPRVFSTVKDLEPYSMRFAIEWDDRDSVAHALPVTPEVYARLAGPYNRRNAYGAVMAAGPVLANDPRLQRMFESVARFGLCDPAPVLQELAGAATFVSRPRVRYQPRVGREPQPPLLLDVPCD